MIETGTVNGQAGRGFIRGRQGGRALIHTILDACQYVLEAQGGPQSPYWLSSIMIEMKLWRADERRIRTALERDTAKFGEESRFVKVDDDEYALRSWTKNPQSAGK
jgi:hypothetical protein